MCVNFDQCHFFTMPKMLSTTTCSPPHYSQTLWLRKPKMLTSTLCSPLQYSPTLWGAASPLKVISIVAPHKQQQQQNVGFGHKFVSKPLNPPIQQALVAASSTSPFSFTTPPGVSPDLSSSAHILEPIRSDGIDVLLYFLPGAFTASSEYIPILKGTQSKCPFKLWVALLDAGEMLLNAEMVESSFDGIIERVTKLGFPSDSESTQNVFVGGHSWGAWESRSFAMNRAKGYIQLASTMHSCPDDLVQYPIPVLTVCGECDGQITLAPAAKHAGDVYATKGELGDYFVNAIKPVAIIPGMNHAQFSHGIPNKERGDFDALIALEEARKVTVDLISSFLALHTSEALEPDHEALSVLSNAVKQTNERYHTFWLAIEDQRRGVKEMQLKLASVKDINVGVTHHEYKDNFIRSKPSIHVPSKHVYVNTYFHIVGKYNIVKNLWVKMKSREAISIAFGQEEHPVKGEEGVSMGAILNQKTFSEALALVSEDARRRFEEHGKKLRFVEDMVIGETSTSEWVDSELAFKQAEDGSGGYMDVQSVVLIVPVHGASKSLGGLHYFKLLTIARAMEWIFMDCYR